MASRGYKTSPEVADLIRTVESTEGWSTRQGARVVQFLHPDGETVIRLDNTADATDLKRAHNALSRYGIGGDTDTITTTETVTIKRTTGFVDPYPTWTVYEKAKKVWKAMRDYAVATSKPLALVDGTEFYVVSDRKLSFFIAKVLPKIREQYEGPGGTREVYDYLRATGNAVRERDEDDNSTWVCRTTWSDEEVTVVFRNPRKAISDYDTMLTKRENRLREEEVSQRLRAPQDDLVVIHTDPLPSAEPAAPTPDPDALTEEEQALLDAARARRALLTCPECKDAGEEFVAGNPQGLAAHRKAAHGVQAKGTTHQSVTPKIKPGDPKENVGSAFALLAEAMDEFLTNADPNEALIAEVAALGTRVAEMQQEVAFLKADTEVQRKRAERAEEIIGCIRLAFDTQPMAQAAASTIELLPPNKDVK